MVFDEETDREVFAHQKSCSCLHIRCVRDLRKGNKTSAAEIRTEMNSINVKIDKTCEITDILARL